MCGAVRAVAANTGCAAKAKNGLVIGVVKL